MSAANSTVSTISNAPLVVRWLDVLLLVATAPFVFVTHLPVAGYLVAVVVWTMQRLLADLFARRATRAGNTRDFIGYTLGSALVRAWLVGLSILAVGLCVGRWDGAIASAMILVAFTVYFLLSLFTRPIRREGV